MHGRYHGPYCKAVPGKNIEVSRAPRRNLEQPRLCALSQAGVWESNLETALTHARRNAVMFRFLSACVDR
jgi:hypothetical protein